MSYYDELNQLCMEKVAARSYGRNPDGSRRTAEQLIMQLGGADYRPNPPKRKKRNYILLPEYTDPRTGERKELSKTFLTGDKKYNFTMTSSKRYEMGRELDPKKKYSDKVIRQNSYHTFGNRLSGAQYGDDKKYRYSAALDDKDARSHYHTPYVPWDGEKRKKAIKKDRAIQKEQIEKFRRKKENITSGKVPEALIGVGLLSAGMMGTKALYDKIKAKNEKKNEQAKKELAAKA
jgi:hypothetical protein